MPTISLLLTLVAAVAFGLIVNFSPLAQWKWFLYVAGLVGVAIGTYRWALNRERRG